jgi:excinuclease ABC subunit C
VSEIDDAEWTAPRLQDAEMTPAVRSLPEILDRLPISPGVYLMKDRRGKVVYVGKAGSLRTRVRQYFQPASSDMRAFIPLLEGIVADIETVVTSNEKEALLLENTLIKRYQPRFNVKLTDDKNYLMIRLDPKGTWPRLEVVRRSKQDGAQYYGPYHSATACRETLRVVNRHFQLRTCTDRTLENRKRPCLQFQIKRCPAPCARPVSPEAYAQQVGFVGLFLEGKNDELLRNLNQRMQEAAATLAFEQAGALRDQIRSLESVLETQHIVSDAVVDQDVIGYYRAGPAVEVVVLFFRKGSLVGNRSFSFGQQEFPDEEILSSFLGLYYDLQAEIPGEILLPFAISDLDLKSEWLGDKRGKKVTVWVPKRGANRSLVELAQKNAHANFSSRRDQGQDSEVLLARLQRRLDLPRLPRRIECYDISHVQGTDPVASMVVFEDGQPAKQHYRTFAIKHAVGGDDFASMHEVLLRRFQRATQTLDKEDPWSLPDLVVVDGGKGQLSVALAAARDALVDIQPGTGLPIIALAKERDTVTDSANPIQPDNKRPDRVFLAHVKDPIVIAPTSAEMFVLARLRDEAHRFAVAFHRSRRKRRTVRTILAEIPGVGPTRQRILLRHFGSAAKVAAASVEDLANVPGMNTRTAEAVRTFFANREKPDAPSVEEERQS